MLRVHNFISNKRRMKLLSKDKFESISAEIDYLKQELRGVKEQVKKYEALKNPTKQQIKEGQKLADMEYAINKRISDAYERKRKNMIKTHNVKSLNFAPYMYDGTSYSRNISNGFCLRGISL